VYTGVNRQADKKHARTMKINKCEVRPSQGGVGKSALRVGNESSYTYGETDLKEKKKEREF